MTVENLYDRYYRLLGNAGIPMPDVDAKAVISHHLGLERNELFLNKDREVPPDAARRIDRDIRRRMRHEPVAYILGYKYFFHDKFLVSRGVLIPRADTEHLLYAVQNTGRTFHNIIDIGTGSGALAVSLSRLFPSAGVTAVDVRLRHARKNVKRLGCCDNVRLIRANALGPMRHLRGVIFDLVVSNPPYLSDDDMTLLGKDAKKYEPRRAFFGGKDGLVFYRRIAEFCDNHLGKGGLIVLETDHKWKEVRDIFWDKGYRHIEIHNDYNGLERVLTVAK